MAPEGARGEGELLVRLGKYWSYVCTQLGCVTLSVCFLRVPQPSPLQGHTKGFPGTRSVVSDHLLGNRLCQGQDLLSGTVAGWGVIAED